MKVAFVHGGGEKLPARVIRHDLHRAASLITPYEASRSKLTQVTVISVSDKESRRLNHYFFKKNRPTNVLSFRYKTTGEIAVSPAVVRREARAHHTPYRARLRWMMVHGLLHLLGYHHERSDRLEKRFERLEQKLLMHLKIEV